MRWPRLAHKFYAWLNGYYWLPCPICQRMTGGHEASCWRDPCTVDNRMVCINCCKGAAVHRAWLETEHRRMVKSMVDEGVLQLRDTRTGEILPPDEALIVLYASDARPAQD